MNILYGLELALRIKIHLYRLFCFFERTEIFVHILQKVLESQKIRSIIFASA